MRHKQCDKSLPICQECSSRHIPCHGYDPNPPTWMHDHDTYQTELRNIKRIVKENFRLARINQNRRSSRAQYALPGPMSRRDRLFPVKSSNGHKTPSILNPYMSIAESHSFMYYLDYIFPLQYPYYVDQPDLGGRGWLFWLLTKSAPLRDAALTLSTLYKQHGVSSRRAENQEENLLQHHGRALHGLRQALSVRQATGWVHNPEQWLESVASALNLISFQVCPGFRSMRSHLELRNWQDISRRHQQLGASSRIFRNGSERLNAL
jgi:hypothetical protein